MVVAIINSFIFILLIDAANVTNPEGINGSNLLSPTNIAAFFHSLLCFLKAYIYPILVLLSFF